MKRLLSLLLRPAIIFPVPNGMVPDKTAALGLLGLMQNANAYAAAMASYATASAPTISAADVAKGVIQLNTGAGGGYAATLPSTQAILTALGQNTIPRDGTFWKPLFIVNNSSGQTATVTAGDAMTTMIGTASVANDITRMMMLRVLGSTIQISNVGALSL